MAELPPLNKSLTQTITKDREMDVDPYIEGQFKVSLINPNNLALDFQALLVKKLWRRLRASKVLRQRNHRRFPKLKEHRLLFQQKP